MRYRYSGLKRETGETVRGHIEAESEEQAYNVLGDHGVVVESLQFDPEPMDDSMSQPGIANAIDRALDNSAKQVRFDKLKRKYRGKSVWVIDREKIKRNVMSAVDAAVRQSQKQADDDAATRDRIADALESLFGDNQNLTSPLSANQETMEDQIQRLSHVVHQLETTMGSLRVASRRPRWQDAPRGPVRHVPADNPNDAVLQEIFKHNMDLRRRINDPTPPKPTAAADKPASKPARKSASKKSPRKKNGA